MPSSLPRPLESARDALQVQVHRLQQVAGPASVLLLVVNLAATTYPLIAWRGIRPEVGIPLVATVLFLLVLAGANVYVLFLGFYKAQVRSNVLHNPVQVYQLLPFEELVWRTIHLPMLRAIQKDTQDQDLAATIETLERWVELGYIPRDEVPEHLKRYYLAREGERL